MATATDTRQVVINRARSVFTAAITDDTDIERLLRLLLAETMARNEVVVVICVGKEQKLPEVLIVEEGL